MVDRLKLLGTLLLLYATVACAAPASLDEDVGTVVLSFSVEDQVTDAALTVSLRRAFPEGTDAVTAVGQRARRVEERGSRFPASPRPRRGSDHAAPVRIARAGGKG